MSYLFIVCHPRSRSTALAAVLGSHPGIAGQSEQRRHYNREANLAEMRRQAAEQYDPPKTGADWFLDKIPLQLRIAQEIHRRDDTRFIFIARRPEAALASMLLMSGGFRRRLRTAADCARLYRQRLRTMIDLFDSIDPTRRIFIDGDRLARDPETHLSAITDLLGLSPPLRNAYRIARSGGIIGDPNLLRRRRQGAIGTTERPEIPVFVDTESLTLWREAEFRIGACGVLKKRPGAESRPPWKDGYCIEIS